MTLGCLQVTRHNFATYVAAFWPSLLCAALVSIIQEPHPLRKLIAEDSEVSNKNAMFGRCMKKGQRTCAA